MYYTICICIGACIYCIIYGQSLQISCGYEMPVHERRRNTNHGDCRGVQIVGGIIFRVIGSAPVNLSSYRTMS